MEHQLKQDLHDYYAWWRRMNALYEDWAQQRGLSTYTLFVLYALIEKDGCTAKEICETWILPKQTVSSILKQLEKQSYITLNISDTDKRSKLICLTDKGRIYASDVVSALLALEENVMVKMGKSSRRTLNASAALFCDIFENEAGGSRR